MSIEPENDAEQNTINDDGYLSDPMEFDENEVAIEFSTPATSRSRKRERYAASTAGDSSLPNTPFASTSLRLNQKINEEVKSLRFANHHRTAFDVDIETLVDHPWRNPHTDYSDYFNYGFTGIPFSLLLHCMS